MENNIGKKSANLENVQDNFAAYSLNYANNSYDLSILYK